jgi:hypothetical protein
MVAWVGAFARATGLHRVRDRVGSLPIARTGRIRRFALLIIVTAVASGWSAGFAHAEVTDVLPNLVADPPTRDYLDSNMGRLLLRFDGFVHNVGPGPLELRGQRASTADPMIPQQRIYRSDGSYSDVAMPGAQMVYADADGHHHWHLQDVVAFSLWDRQRTRAVAPAMKVGFCVADHEHIDAGIGPASPVYSDNNGRAFCQKENPNALNVWEGVSAGWRDLYERSLVFQWVDVSDVQPGVYWLREDIDPDRIIREANPVKVPAYEPTPTTIPGYDAKPLSLKIATSRSPTKITLGADRYGPTGAVRFRVDTPPMHGTLNVRRASLFARPTVTYRPKRGYRGPDRFTYVARDSASRYPYAPVEATVSLNVGPPLVSSPRVSPSTFRLGSLLPNFSGSPQLGATISFELSAPARATLTFSRCIASTGSNNRARRCIRQVDAGSVTFNAHAGTNAVGFQGRLSRKRSLKPGHYTVTIVAVDDSRKRSNSEKVSFTLLAR